MNIDGDMLLLVGAAFLAGLVDAVVGGGGLVLIPALFMALPQVAPATILGTNKFSAIFGTASAARRYALRIQVPWRAALPTAIAAFCFSYVGAMSVSLMPKEQLRPLVLVMLVAVAVYTFARKDFGSIDQGRAHTSLDTYWSLLLGAAIGFYDGFFGPGAGSFLLFLFIRFFGFDFLRASAAAKIVNVATNGAALIYFSATGHVLWGVAILLALFNVGGALLGTRLALRYGSGFVRRVFLGVATALIGKFGYDTFA
ncbi:MAG: sulfite exporter TauE/SafE family protein [Rhodocyclaceae bacterium]|nr:MAG: sulfite exporter TauE/SafE family protein [Rhodocyclaceae bacterium]